MGLLIYVYRDSLGDCTGGGVSSKARELCVVNVEGPFEPGPNCPAVKLVPGILRNGAPRLVPVDQPEGLIGPMMGGNYAGTSDSRFCEAIEKMCGVRGGIAPVFDRFETQEVYDRLTI